MNQNEAVFRDAPVRTAVVRMAVPTVISSLVLVIYNMADTFFVGQTHDAMQVAAVSLTNPVFVMFMAIANLLGIGGSAVISILLGQQMHKEGKTASLFCCYASLVFGVLSALIILPLMATAAVRARAAPRTPSAACTRIPVLYRGRRTLYPLCQHLRPCRAR